MRVQLNTFHAEQHNIDHQEERKAEEIFTARLAQYYANLARVRRITDVFAPFHISRDDSHIPVELKWIRTKHERNCRRRKGKSHVIRQEKWRQEKRCSS